MRKRRQTYIAGLLAAATAMFTSCSDQYNIMGSSSVDSYEGNTLYLKVVTASNEMCPYDSAEVVHGKFGFEGIVDTVCMAQLFFGEHSLLPLVLETGDINISFSDAEQVVRGGTLNDRLYKFLNENSRLQSEISDNSHSVARMIMQGFAPSQYTKIERKSEMLQERLDKLWTSFIIDNCDNILGPTYFQEYTSQYFYPVITPQIEKILRKAPQSFLSNPDVQLYIREARYNMQQMQGGF